MELMNEYLSSDNKVKPNFVVIKNITFTISYESKSILLAYKEEEENSNGNLQKKEDARFNSTEETENLRSGNCNAENYLPWTAKHCKVHRCAFKTIRIFIR